MRTEPGRASSAIFLAAFIFLTYAPVAFGHDDDPVVDKWMKDLMQPDAPYTPCCGKSDAYWADGLHVRDGRTFAVITDDRDDGPPLNRRHVPVGTEIEIPDYKLKWDSGNPTGHAIVFLGDSRQVFCYVQGTGI